MINIWFLLSRLLHCKFRITIGTTCFFLNKQTNVSYNEPQLQISFYDYSSKQDGCINITCANGDQFHHKSAVATRRIKSPKRCFVQKKNKICSICMRKNSLILNNIFDVITTILIDQIYIMQRYKTSYLTVVYLLPVYLSIYYWYIHTITPVPHQDRRRQ